MNEDSRYVYAYGNPDHPLIVGSFGQAVQRARAVAERTGELQSVMRLDLSRPDLNPEILGQHP